MAEDSRRLAVHIPAAVDLRLRLQRSVTGRQMGDIVTELLDGGLPTAEDLAEQISGKENADVG